MCKVGDVLTL